MDKLQTTVGVEVLIIGAGPSGLMAATALKRAGIDVRIVDKRWVVGPEATRDADDWHLQSARNIGRAS